MNREKIFPNAVHKYFKFLLDMGFSIYDKIECDTGAFGNGCYTFRSDAVGVEITLDRGDVFMTIGKTAQDRRDWLEWANILKAYAPNIKSYGFDLGIEAQVQRLSELMQRYCIKLLNGDFSDENLLKEIEENIGKGFLKRFLKN